jgi:hypothetical protein
MFFKNKWIIFILPMLIFHCPSPGQLSTERRCKKEKDEDLIFNLVAYSQSLHSKREGIPLDVLALVEYSYKRCLEQAKAKGFHPTL